MTADAPQSLPDGRPVPLTTGDERPMPESRLDFHRATLELKCAGLDDTGRIAGGPMAGLEVSVRWVFVHMIEEYARHNGHADILRERIDGITGA
ncbi:hypothetical protein C1I97_30130 [Streptomyces sp. NTH33]|uniref:mycothiol transferase n=1 Tax=Streptomyces sp. NTH33 TaxID=1735453 RepID=UPI000DA9A3EC|nr:DUF664 domain-containing protein [Streptomyces sp. NTH33]PZG91183.1 hypothetical protein C1I97_30130 [Streptomyces sp. NTH33]